jgi:predicted ATPase
VSSAIAQALGVRESGGQPFLECLKGYLREKRILLLLDNFEHLLDAAALVAELLATTAELKVLVTSRERLHLRGEQEVEVPPLALPDTAHLPALNQLSQYAAIALFMARAQAVQPSFQVTSATAPAVAAICCQIDGLPLAIELAAARVRLFAPATLLARLNDRIHGTPLRLLVGGPRDMPERQRTLRSTIDWSYNLLAPEEQRLFARLGGFSGGWDLEAAAAVCDAAAAPEVLEGLEALVERSMVRMSDGPIGEPRFGMLETIREYALEHLEACGELAAVQDRHADYFLALAERAREAKHTARARFWLGQLTAEHNNLRAALANLDARGQPLKLARLCASMAWFWWYRGHYEEAQHWSARALAQHAQLSPALHALLRLECSWFPPRIEQRIAYLETSLALYRALGDQQGAAWALVGLSLMHHRNGDDEAARGPTEECLSLARALRDPALLAAALVEAGELALAECDQDRAQPLLEEALALYRDLGNEQNISGALFALADAAQQRGAYQSAEALYTESAALRRAMGDRRGAAAQIGNVGTMALRQGDVARATSLQCESLSIYREIGWEQGIGWALLLLAECANALDRHERVARLLGAEEQIRTAIGYQIWPASRVTYERMIAATRAVLGDDAFAAAWTAGRAMSREQTSAYALGQDV